MSDTALRLAEFIERDYHDETLAPRMAAAELRRLHAENERLRQINQSHEMKLSVRGYEIQIDDLKALNAELLEALRKCDEAMAWDQGGEPMDTLMVNARNAARAALAKVEASK